MKISEVEKEVGISSKAIRYYESRGLLSVARGENSYREYGEADIEVLRGIKSLRVLGISLADIRLWRDNVVNYQELLIKRMKELESSSRENEKQKRLCEAALSGAEEEYGTDEYIEPELERASGGVQTDPVYIRPLALGIDIGTTSISAVLTDITNGKTVEAYNIAHNAAAELGDYPDAFAQDAEGLINRTVSFVDSLINTYGSIKAIGFAGQMHGIVCIGKSGEILSPLYTWQNEFANRTEDGAAYTEIIERLTGERVSTGYGIVTLYCLDKMGLLPAQTASVTTIMDLAVMRLCGMTRAICNPTNAASLGFYDIAGGAFKTAVLKRLGIDVNMLPEVRDGFFTAGIYRGIPVSAAIGDNQASVFGSLNSDGQMLVNIGTSSQISVITDRTEYKKGDVRPYFNGKYIVSGASLCGGRAYSLLAGFFADVLKLGGVKLKKNELYEKMNALAEEPPENELTVSTKFAGTRDDPSSRGSICGIGTDNFTCAQLVRGVLRGIVGELRDMYDGFSDGRERDIVISGNAVRRNPALQRIIGEVFGGKPLIPEHIEEAAYGAALFAAVSACLISKEDIGRLIRYK